MELISRILKRGIYGYDRNSLHPFERALFSATVQIQTHNILFMSVQMQLRCFLDLQTTRMSCVPDWFSRNRCDDCLVVTPQRIVGGHYGAPPIDPKPSFSLHISHLDHAIGKLQIDADQSIRRITTQFLVKSIDYPVSVDSISVSAEKVPDERGYWASRRNQLGRISDLVSDTVDEGKFVGNVVVCNPKSAVADSLFGIGLCPSYQRLLKFCDGIQVNGLVIYGFAPKPNRLFDERGRKYLSVGDDQHYMYAYPVSGEKTSEKLVRFRNQSGRRGDSGMTVIELLERALL